MGMKSEMLSAKIDVWRTLHLTNEECSSIFTITILGLYLDLYSI